jgi:hypothetical protein
MSTGDGSGPSSERLRGAAAAKLHATLAAGLALCVFAGAFELYRALSGNELSWAYVFEWPLFGVFGTYVWWKLLHEDAPEKHRRERPAVVLSKDDADRLEEWNRYLAELHASEPDEPGQKAPRP